MKRLWELLIVVLAVLCFFTSFASAGNDRKLDRLKELSFFKSEDGCYIAYNNHDINYCGGLLQAIRYGLQRADFFGKWYAMGIYYSQDGTNFNEIRGISYKEAPNNCHDTNCASHDNYHVMYFETRDNQRGSWIYDNGRISFGVFNKIFEKVPPLKLEEINFIALPETRIPIYVFSMIRKPSMFSWVSSDEYQQLNMLLRLYIDAKEDYQQLMMSLRFCIGEYDEVAEESTRLVYISIARYRQRISSLRLYIGEHGDDMKEVHISGGSGSKIKSVIERTTKRGELIIYPPGSKKRSMFNGYRLIPMWKIGDGDFEGFAGDDFKDTGDEVVLWKGN